jgi:N6-adenosine-specific RNA methylase IME4
MDVAAICRLNVERIAAPDSALALWVYDPLRPAADRVMEAWGFTYVKTLVNWVKTTKNGKLAFGTGYYTHNGSEQLILGTRGKGLRVQDRGLRQVLMAERREHSRKPDEAWEILERLFGDVRRVELFARRPRAGWTSWGNQLGEVV